MPARFHYDVSHDDFAVVLVSSVAVDAVTTAMWKSATTGSKDAGAGA